MLSMFPTFLNHALLAPFIIRIALGVTFLVFGYKNIKKKEMVPLIFGILETILGLSILTGLMTQLSAILVSLILILFLLKKIKDRALFTDGVNYYALLLAMSLSLIVTGAGAWAFDLPL